MPANKLIILDDTFPNLASGFRIAEFSHYLRAYENSVVYTTTSLFDRYRYEYARLYPDLAYKVRPFAAYNDFSCALAYMMFLSNVHWFLPVLEHFKMPFVFTLCDGGFFHLDDPESDSKLLQVCSSPWFRKVITPIEVINDYLIKKNFTSPDKIEFVEGGIVTQIDYWEKNLAPKRYYQKDKSTFDICFIAYKYKPQGTDKGYDTFVEAARKLADYSPDFRFHVVGGFDENDIDVSGIRDRFHFYGRQYQDFFPGFYSMMDIHLSLMTLKKERMLHPGRIAGVCNTTAVQSALNRVAVFGIFEPEKIEEFIDGQDLVIIPEDVDRIVETVLSYFNDSDTLYRLSAAGRKKFARVYSVENQLGRRVEILNQYLRQ